MRHLAGSLCSLSLGFSALCHAVLAENGAKPSEAVVIRSSGQSEPHFAFAIRGQSLAAAVRRHVILVDTSASQTGRYRDQGIDLVASLAEQIPTGHSVMVAGIDSSFEPLTNGFVAGGSEKLKHAVDSLRRRTPMGATDLAASLRQTLSDTDAGPTSVLYIGDGMSAANQLSLRQVETLVDDLTDRSMIFHAVLLGPKVDHQLSGILVNQTGGTIEVAEQKTAAETAGKLILAMTVAPVTLQNVKLSDGQLELAVPDHCAVRPDRDTVLFGRGVPAGRVILTGQTPDGTAVSWSCEATGSRQGGAELRMLYQQAEQSGGVNVPVVGVEGLQKSADGLQTVITSAVETAERLRQRGQSEQAMAVTRRALEIDAANPLLTSMALSLQEETGPLAQEAPAGSADDRLGAPSASEEDPLAKTEARNEIITQQLVQSTNAAIEEANRVAAEEPEYALSLLKDLLNTVRSSRELAPEKQDELERRIVNAYSRVDEARQASEVAQRIKSQKQANEQAVKDLLEASQIEEQRLQTLIAQVRGLLDRARHGDVSGYEKAEVAARTALDMQPGNGPAAAAVVMAEASGQLHKAYELINLRHDRFLETLYQVELSHVPFPDEPPIQYPPADVWRALTLSRREKYESVSLRSEKDVELWLEQILDSPPIPHLDYGQNTSLREILDAIESHYTLLGPYTMRIFLDESDPDIGEDPEFLENTQVSGVDLQGISLRNALKLILAKVKDQELTFIIKNEVMLITTVATAESEENLVTRVYQVADLVVPTIAPQGGGGLGGQGGIGGGGQGGFGGGGLGGGGLGGGGLGGGGLGGGAFSIAPETLKPQQPGLNFGGAKKKPAH